jgi:hypothetical protein
MAPIKDKKGSRVKVITRSNDSSSRAGLKRSKDNHSLDDYGKKHKSKYSKSIQNNSSSDPDDYNMTESDQNNHSDDNEKDDEDNIDSNVMTNHHKKLKKKASTANSDQKHERRHSNDSSEEASDHSKNLIASTGNSHHKVDRRQLVEEGYEDSLEDRHWELAQRVKFIEKKLSVLESKVEKQSVVFFKKGSQSKMFKLNSEQVSFISIVVRGQVFSRVKYFDYNCIVQEGENIFKLCLARAGMTGNEADEATLKLLLTQQIKHVLAQKRAHVNTEIRNESKGMFLLLH